MFEGLCFFGTSQVDARQDSWHGISYVAGGMGGNNGACLSKRWRCYFGSFDIKPLTHDEMQVMRPALLGKTSPIATR